MCQVTFPFNPAPAGRQNRPVTPSFPAVFSSSDWDAGGLAMAGAPQGQRDGSGLRDGSGFAKKRVTASFQLFYEEAPAATPPPGRRPIMT